MAERTLVLSRHLATDFNKSGDIMGRGHDLAVRNDDVAIDKFEKSIDRAFSGIKVTPDNTIFLSSPLNRCIQTSNIAIRALGIKTDVVVIDELTETDMGDFTGKKADRLREEYGDKLINDWMFSPEDFTFPNGESYAAVRERVGSVFSLIKGKFENNEYANVFVCTHVDIVKMFLSEIL